MSKKIHVVGEDGDDPRDDKLGITINDLSEKLGLHYKKVKHLVGYYSDIFDPFILIRGKRGNATIYRPEIEYWLARYVELKEDSETLGQAYATLSSELRAQESKPSVQSVSEKPNEQTLNEDEIIADAKSTVIVLSRKFQIPFSIGLAIQRLLEYSESCNDRKLLEQALDEINEELKFIK